MTPWEHAVAEAKGMLERLIDMRGGMLPYVHKIDEALGILKTDYYVLEDANGNTETCIALIAAAEAYRLATDKIWSAVRHHRIFLEKQVERAIANLPPAALPLDALSRSEDFAREQEHRP